MLLEVKNLKKYFKIAHNAYLKAVDNVSFSIEKGETLGLVGESGCGKSTLGRTIIGLYPPTEGSILFEGKETAHLTEKQRVPLTKEMQIIYQDPYACLDPRMTVADIIAEGLDIHGMSRGAERRKRIFELLELVGMNAEHANRFPHEFSGGQRQRIGIARALAVEPRLLICDEAVSALDVSAQAQTLGLLAGLQRELGLAYLFIAHDLAAVRQLSHRVAVMYLGRIVEVGPAEDVLSRPLHPYTRMLIEAAPIPDPEKAKARALRDVRGEPPSPLDAPPGCAYAPRCPLKTDVCGRERPELRGEDGHRAACHYC